MASDDYTYRVLTDQDRKNAAENMLRDVERQIFQTQDQLASSREQDSPNLDAQEKQLKQLKARADRLWGIVQEVSEEEE